MRIPDRLFAIINPTLRCLLQSPLHRFWSKNLMLITFTGRKTGKIYTTPVRYLKSDGEAIREALREFLSHFPQDAPYYDIGLTSNRRPVEKDLDRAARKTAWLRACPQ